MNATLDLLADLAIAFAVGILIGLQREQAGKGILAAGSRTFPLVALTGAVVQEFFPRLLPVAFGGIVVLAALGYLARVREAGDPGLATSMAATLTFVLGAAVMVSDRFQLVAVILAVVVTVVLALKEPLHGFARRLSAGEVRATLTFLVIALVVLPLLPDESVAWLLGLNPRFVWTMVVFVSAVDLSAYLFVKLFATRRGHLLAGVVGGLVSSTATTVSMARRTRSNSAMADLYRIAIVVASIVMLVRMAVEVAVLDLGLLRVVAPALALLLLWCAIAVAWWLRRAPEEDANGAAGPRNPFRLAPALLFGLFFASILLVTAWLNNGFGDIGIYGASIVSGMVGVDAVTMTLARLHAEGTIPEGTAAAGILLVAASNFAFKVGIVLVVGTKRLGAQAGLVLGAAAAAAAGIAIAWG